MWEPALPGTAQPHPFIAGRSGYVAATRTYRIAHGIGQRLWIIPWLGILAGLALSLLTVAIDRRNVGLLSRASSGTRQMRS